MGNAQLYDTHFCYMYFLVNVVKELSVPISRVFPFQRKACCSLLEPSPFTGRKKGGLKEETEKFLLAAFPGRDLEHFITTSNCFSSVNTLYSGSQNCIQKGEICFL